MRADAKLNKPDNPGLIPVTGYPDSWYLDTVRGLKLRPRLRAAERADVCVIGGGYTGLSAALHLAERGYDVVLLEAHRVGWGAAGRNGGQVGSGQRRDESELEAMLGPGTARRLWDLAEEAKGIVRERVARHGIACDLKDGQLIVAAQPARDDGLRKRADKLACDYGYAQARYVPAAELPAMVGSRAFSGGLLDTGAMHLHPLNFALGLANACDAAGVRIYEHSAVLDYTLASPASVRTELADVTARQLVGGGENYRGGFPKDIAAFVRPYMLEVFPQLADVAIDRAWGGALGISRTRLPHVGRLPPNIFFAHGFSGHGISIGMLAGKLIAEAVAGTTGRFDVLARLPAPAWPGGTLLRWPLLVLGMLYYSLRDRL